MDPLNAALKDLEILYTQLARKLIDPNAPDNPLSRKSISHLSNKLYSLINSQSTSDQQSNQTKSILLQVFNSHLTNYLNNHLVSALIKCQNEDSFTSTVTQGWMQFKRFAFTYHALLIHGHEYYEKESVKAKERNPLNQPANEFTILPVPALSLKLFNQLVLSRFTSRLERAALNLLSRQRQKQQPEDQRLRIILSIYWSCSLKELARISMSKTGNISFWKEKNSIVVQHFKESNQNQKTFQNRILISLGQNTAYYYNQLYWNRLRELHAQELVQHLQNSCKKQESMAAFHMPSAEAINHYLTYSRNALLDDLEAILTKPMSFKFIFLNCADHLEELFPQAMLYFSLFRRISQKSISLVCKLVGEAISEKGQQINTKILKSREYIPLMLKFKKAVRYMFDSADSHCLEIEQTVEKQFKKLLQSLEASKGLAQYTDWTIKQCVRLKLDDENCENRFKDITFLLASLAAKDSYLIHYQEYLSRRLLDSINQPRIDIEEVMLKMLGEQLGTITIAHHLSMIKDIEKSIHSSQQLHNRLPFISYKWDLRVFNPAVWPQSSVKQKYSNMQVPALFKEHSILIQELYHQKMGVHLRFRLDRGSSLFEGVFTSGKVRFQAENSYLFILLHLQEQNQGKITFQELTTFFSDKNDNKTTSSIQNLVQVLIECSLVHREAKEGAIGSEQMISLNTNYKTPAGSKPQIPILIKPSPALLKSFAQNNVDQTRILKQRQKLVDAMLVKLLKHSNATKQNRITFQQLYDGVRSNNFLKSLQIPQNMVKKRLQYLIVNQYCIRDEEDRKIYHYIA